MENLSQCAVWVCPWPGMLLLEGEVQEQGCAGGTLPVPAGVGVQGSLTAAAPGAAVSQQIVVPPILQLLVAL